MKEKYTLYQIIQLRHENINKKKVQNFIKTFKTFEGIRKTTRIFIGNFSRIFVNFIGKNLEFS